MGCHTSKYSANTQYAPSDLSPARPPVKLDLDPVYMMIKFHNKEDNTLYFKKARHENYYKKNSHSLSKTETNYENESHCENCEREGTQTVIKMEGRDQNQQDNTLDIIAIPAESQIIEDSTEQYADYFKNNSAQIKKQKQLQDISDLAKSVQL